MSKYRLKDLIPWISTVILALSVLFQYLEYSRKSEKADSELTGVTEQLDAIRESASDLEDQIDQMHTEKDALEDEIRDISDANAALRKSTDYIRQIAKDESESHSGHNLPEIARNAGYFVVVSAVESDREWIQEISSNIGEQGFSVSDPVFYQNTPGWYPLTSTVFYYSEVSKLKAAQLAETIKELTQQHLVIERGPANRVARTNADWKFEVLLLNQRNIQ